jgi:hypothetical protein
MNLKKVEIPLKSTLLRTFLGILGKVRIAKVRDMRSRSKIFKSNSNCKVPNY